MLTVDVNASTWYYPQCGRKNDQQFCPVDGTRNPIGVESDSEAFVPALYVGKHIQFGQYEQDDNLNNGKEPIEWRVLAANNNEALLISEYGLDCYLYHQLNASIIWAESSLRTWLNNSFYNSAFSYEEQAVIVCKRIANDDSQNASYDGKVILWIMCSFSAIPRHNGTFQTMLIDDVSQRTTRMHRVHS